MSETAYRIFELSVNLIQGAVFALFCNLFFTPRFKKTVNIPLCTFIILLLFSAITAINLYFNTIANIEILAYLLIMIPFSVCCHKGKLFLKIIMPLIIFVIYMCVSMLYSAFISVVLGKSIEQVMMYSSIYRFIYVATTNITFILVLFLIYRVYKNKIDIKKPVDIIACFVIPVLTMVLVFLATAVITDESTSETNRIYLGIITLLAFIVSFSMFPIMEQIGKAAEVKALNTLMAKEKEMYKSEISNHETYIEEISHVKHEMKRKLFCISELLESGNTAEAKKICRSTDDALSNIVPAFRTSNIYLNTILNKANITAKNNQVTVQFTVKSTLTRLDSSDLLSLLGNLIDNAFEALKKVTSEKLLKLIIFEKEHYYIIAVKNSICKSVLEENPDLTTTKSDKKAHGHGIKIVKNIVKKNNGNISFTENENTFEVNVMLEKPESA